MLKGIDKNEELKNVRLSEEGYLEVKIVGTVEQNSDKEYTLKSQILNVGTTATSFEINKKITDIMVANYSETSNVSITVEEETLQVGSNLALELPINKQVNSLSVTATEDNTKIQLVVKGVE